MRRRSTRRAPRGGGDARDGFALSELLVVVIVLAVVAALAIPAFLGQRDRAGDAAAKSLVRSAAMAVEAAYDDTRDYAAIIAAAVERIEPAIDVDGGGGLARNGAVALTIAPTGFTISSTSDGGTTYTMSKDTTATPAIRRTDSTGSPW